MTKIYAPILDKTDHSGKTIKGFVLIELTDDVKKTEWYQKGKYILPEELEILFSLKRL